MKKHRAGRAAIFRSGGSVTEIVGDLIEACHAG